MARGLWGGAGWALAVSVKQRRQGGGWVSSHRIAFHRLPGGRQRPQNAAMEAHLCVRGVILKAKTTI
ncbi:hypothetical protein KAM354_43700 [Aeromonas caviae]|nr:hypothetical protein KAM354_43700 [Aeromonas caviae]